jgi:Tfp pilus assembly protein PilF
MTKEHIRIKDIHGDAIGLGISGSGNFVGKEIHYTVNGNVFNIKNPNTESLTELRKILAVPSGDSGDDVHVENVRSLGELKNLEKRMDEILKLVKATDQRLSSPTTEIKADEITISRIDLLIKRAIILTEEASRYLDIMSSDSRINLYRSKRREALYILRQANRLDPHNTEVLLRIAKIQSMLNPNYPNLVQKILYRVQNLLEDPKNTREKFQLAQATFMLATCTDEINHELLQDARLIFEELGKVDWVRKCVSLLPIDPNTDQGNLWTEKGWTLGKLKKYDKALECFDKAIQMKSRNVKTWRGKGTVLAMLGKYHEAITYYERGIDLDPKDVPSLKGKGTCLYYLKDYEHALVYFEQALKMGPEDESTILGKARILQRLERLDEAIAAYDSAILINPSNADAYFGKGQTIGTLGLIEDAVKCFDKSIEIDPDNAPAWYAKGETLRKLGMDEDAVKCLDKSIEIDRDNTEQ